MTKPSVRRQGELLLHICGVNDMEVNKWMKFFKEDEIDWLLNTPEGKNVCSRNPLATEQVLNTLKGLTVEAPESYSETFEEEQLHIVSVSNESPLKRPSVPPTSSNKGLPYMLETDKGEMYNVVQIKDKLEPLYNIKGFNEIFYQSLVDIGVSPDIMYISTSKKKVLVGKLKTLAKKALDKQTEEI